MQEVLPLTLLRIVAIGAVFLATAGSILVAWWLWQQRRHPGTMPAPPPIRVHSLQELVDEGYVGGHRVDEPQPGRLRLRRYTFPPTTYGEPRQVEIEHVRHPAKPSLPYDPRRAYRPWLWDRPAPPPRR